MKNLVTIIIAMVMGLSLSAQTFPVSNGGFENWGGNAPQNWTVSLNGNIMVELFGAQVPIPLSVNFGSQSTDAHSGASALKLGAQMVGIPTTEYNFLLPGIAQLGTSGQFSIPASTLLNLANGVDSIGMGDLEALSSLVEALASGDSCNKTPSAVKLWVKYFPQEGDSLMVIAATMLDGAPVSMAQLSFGTTCSEYTQLTVPFDAPGAMCDSILIVIVSGGFQTSEATELYVDDVELEYGDVAVADRDGVELEVYPNPAADLFVVSPAAIAEYDFQLVDMTGRVVKAQSQAVGQTTVPVSDLSAGVYMLKVFQEGRQSVRKILVR
ncbi:MAG: T9SS type A sorting domain-containing protein [Bacteroidales bacterium]|nr:T9SS type A sorting domain-containing protein [Bacteroidales bacterium]